jgi:flagellar protein FliS
MNPYQTTGIAARTYATNDVETGALAASPQMLIVMLYEGAIRAIVAGKADLARGDHAAKGRALSKAIGIIDEGLKGSLDVEAGGDIGANLMALYDYMTQTLLDANLRNDTGAMDQVASLLRELKGAWESVARDNTQQPPEPRTAPERAAAAAISYGKA